MPKRSATPVQSTPQSNPPANGQLDARALLNALVAAKNGDFSVRLPLHWTRAKRQDRRRL